MLEFYYFESLFLFFIDVVVDLTCICHQIAPLKVKFDYFNSKYIKFVNIPIRKTSIHSPYYIHFEADILFVGGNNVMVRTNNKFIFLYSIEVNFNTIETCSERLLSLK